MKSTLPKEFYRRVPAEQQEVLLRFRREHPQKHLFAQSVSWSYLAGGRGQEAIVLLPGGLGLAEAWFQLIMAFDNEFRTLAVTYPPVSSMKDLADGIACILAAEGIQRAHVLGTSMGGMLAQCFVRQYPDKVGRLIVANTAAPNKAYADHLERHNQRSLRFPMWLIRMAFVRSLGGHLAAVPAGEREFWKAYFKEAIYAQWDRDSIARQNRCIVDYARNYAFKPGDLAQTTNRILIIESDDDRAIRPELGAGVRELYLRARVHTFHGAGHIPVITRREDYIALIREFLRANSD